MLTYILLYTKIKSVTSNIFFQAEKHFDRLKLDTVISRIYFEL